MATLRKLQQEIDKVLKKVVEGLEEFDTTFEQMTMTENQNTRDKYESNLKAELKKLQKYREQIKSWIGNSDVKDTSELMESKRDIERRMEGFKAFEKESKTKAYSKEGLQAAAAKLDPRQRAKQEERDWLNNTVETLSSQVEEMEAEIEEIHGKNRKKNKVSPRLSLLEDTVARHQLHVGRLEKMLRLLDNEMIESDDVEEIRDLLDDYIDRCMDSPDEFINPDDIYADLVDMLDSHQDTTVSHLVKEKGMSAKDKEREREKMREEQEREKQKAAAAAAKALLAAQGNLRLVSDDSVAQAKPVTPSKAPVSPPAVPPPPPPPPPPASKKGSDSTPLSPMAGTSALSAPSTPVHAFAAVASAGTRSSDNFPSLGAPHKDHNAPLYAYNAAPGSEFSSSMDDEKLDNGEKLMTEHLERMQVQDSRSDIPHTQTLQLLQISAPRSIPQLSDSRWSLLSQRPMPSPVAPPSTYPAQKLPLFDAPVFYDSLDIETLMYSFYFQPGSMQQFLSSRSLGNKSWKFNEETRKWFSVSDANPGIATKLKQAGESMSSQYIHFDPSGWAFRG